LGARDRIESNGSNGSTCALSDLEASAAGIETGLVSGATGARVRRAFRSAQAT
jgi:hypothetical protein